MITVTESGKALPHRRPNGFNMDMLYIVRLVRLSTYVSILSARCCWMCLFISLCCCLQHDSVPTFYSRTAAGELRGHSSLLRQSAVFAVTIAAKQ